MKTTSQIYGKGANLEMYPVREHNISKNKDLRSCDRKPKGKKKA